MVLKSSEMLLNIWKNTPIAAETFLLNMHKYILAMTLALSDVYRIVMFGPDVVYISLTGPSVRAF